MLSNPDNHEIDHHTMKLVVGIIALSLAGISSFLTGGDISSVSASYYGGGWGRDYFVGSLFAIFGFFIAYNGDSRIEMLLSKLAAFAALGVAMFPCHCKTHEEIIPGVHGASAAVLFIVLAVFCFQFHKRAKGKTYPEASRRSVIYTVCGIAIIASIAVLAVDNFMGGALSTIVMRLTFYCEMMALVAFGVAWLTASRVLPVLTNTEERIRPFQ